MKHLLSIVFLALFLIIGTGCNAIALEDNICECGVDAGGNCIPCGTLPNDKADSSNKADKPIPEKVCPCNSDATGNCLPCDDTGLEQPDDPTYNKYNQ